MEEVLRATEDNESDDLGTMNDDYMIFHMSFNVTPMLTVLQGCLTTLFCDCLYESET